MHAYKFNGFLYRSYEFPSIIEENDEYVCIDTSKAKVIFYKKEIKKLVFSRNNRPTIWYFFKKEWFNIILSIKFQKVYTYINVASPYIIEEEAIKFIDLDLDYLNKDLFNGKWEELDLDEFEQNSVEYKYPSELIEKVKLVQTDIKDKIKNGYFNQFYNKHLLGKNDE